ncbi:MAG: hypothetical protein ACLTXI_02925 [Collinsella sp.]
MHINRGNRTISVAVPDRLDFYMFQPGHNYEASPRPGACPGLS